MKQPLYSSTLHSQRSGGRPGQRESAPARPAEPTHWQRLAARSSALYRRHERPALIFSGVLAALIAVLSYAAVAPKPHIYTQNDINRAVKYTLSHQPEPPSRSAIAARIVAPSVVRIDSLLSRAGDENARTANKTDKAKKTETTGRSGAEALESIGTGVVIDTAGTILTNLHVIAAAQTVRVTFYDGTQSPAEVVATDAGQDLAVLKPRVIPDDLKPAVLATTRDLHPGDDVVAVGFPFGVGPSVSAGVVSGLRRQWDNPSGHTLKNLIQFDAAANPGNSGGPLVDDRGDVVGLVTAFLNPTNEHVFIGIGFAVPIENAAALAGPSPF